MRYSLMLGCGTINTIILKQLQEKFLAKNKNFYFAFVDLEKALDQVLRDVVRWTL